MIPQIVGALGSAFLSKAFGPDEEAQLGLWEPQASALEKGYGVLGDVLKGGRQRLVGMNTPFGSTPWGPGVDAGMPEATNLGFGAYHQGGGAYDYMTDVGQMMDVASNPYIAAAARAAGNEAARHVKGTSAGKNYGGSSYMKTIADTVFDATAGVYNQALDRNMQAMLGASAQMPQYAQTPLELMNAYQMADMNFANAYQQGAGVGPKFGTGQEAPDMLAAAGKGWDFGGEIAGSLPKVFG